MPQTYYGGVGPLVTAGPTNGVVGASNNGWDAFNYPMYATRGDAQRAGDAAQKAADAAAASLSSAGMQKTALQGNVNNFGDIQALTDKINALNIAAQQQANAARIPGATGLEEKSSANISSALGGQLPADVLAQLAQGAAERGVGTGQPGGDQVNSAYLRALGLNSLKLQDQ